MLGILLFSPPLNAQEDPARFLLATEWVGTFTRTLTHSGTSAENSVCKWQWDHSHSSQITLPLLHDPVRHWTGTWAGTTNDSKAVQVSGGGSEICDRTTLEWTFSRGIAHGEEFQLRVNTENKTYTVDFGSIDYDYTTKRTTRLSDGSTVTDTSTVTGTMCWSPPVTSPLPESGVTLSGRVSVRFGDLMDGEISDLLLCAGIFLDGVDVGPETEVVVTWNLVPKVEELELVVEPSGYPEDTPFEEWLPEGNLKDWNNFGNTLRVRAWLQTTDGQAPTNRPTSFTFQLLEVSHEPGVCMNWPTRALSDTKSDLRFDEELNDQPFVVVGLPFWLDESAVVSLPEPNANGLPEAEAFVSSYDFGSYGKLKVTAQVAGHQIVGYLKSDPSKTRGEILLPKRTAPSRIADYWKQTNSVSSLADNDDSENDPPGDDHKGDGLTLYEEYRGFSENLAHLRAKPTRKDLLIADTINTWRSKNGIELFKTQSGLEVHHKFQVVELSSQPSKIDRWINFNRSSASPHVVDQHGLVLAVNAVDVGFSRAFPSSDEFKGLNSTPGSKEVILINNVMSAPSIDPALKKNIDGINVIRRDGSLTLTDFAQATTAHELAHGCSVWHHGHCDSRKMEWLVAINIGDTNASYTVSENGVDLVLMREPNVVLREYPFSGFFGKTNIYLGMPQGEHSGVEDCFMRYAVAEAYPHRSLPNIRYWVRGDELKGLFLCDSTDGTDVNADNRVPQPRYGNAATGRGKCKGQICVSDRYLRDSLHFNRDITCP